ncbi:MFS transporter [Nonomuraea sp. NN258]|uniref:MFS transporter n=1 Tax=Nonomuraea antri TaxID=2730852 RepID=UPI0015699552|nr:MFS transporter [Nonomuraea antri]NRQ30981.1 MFS transporter [Nonomuraea antri]
MPRTFTVIWSSQLLSIITSSVTGFVLGVWVFQRTGSATQFVTITLCAILPEVLFAPLAGSLADRWDRRKLMMGADLGAALTTGALALLLVTGEPQVWHIYLITAVGAVFGTAQMAAYHSMMPLLVPKEQLGRANGMMQVADAVRIAAPLLAGTLLVGVGMTGVVVIDLVAFLVSRVVLHLVPLPSAVTRPGEGRPAEPWLRDLAFGIRYLRARQGLLWLVGLLAAYNLFFGMAGVLVQPLILSFGSAAVLGALMAAGGAGVFVGGLVLSAWGGPKQRVRGLLGFMAAGGALLAAHSLSPSAALIAVVAPAFLFTLPFVQGTGITILQLKTPPDELGRVLSTVRMVTQAATVLTYLAAGPLADQVFEPMLAPGGLLAGSVGELIGTGPGRGIALIFIIAGAGLLVLAPLAYLQPRLRRVETELPDIEEPSDAAVSRS